MSHPWAPGSATGVGSMPGTAIEVALGVVLDTLPLPFLPELPARGSFADLAGRSTALLHGLSVDLQPSGWRLTPGPSGDGIRARDALRRDLDALEERTATAGAPDVLKVSCAGPWTLAALLELNKGERALADHGAVRDLAASLAEGLALHVAEVAQRVPGARVVLQLDEPSLPAVLAARIRTSSGVATLRAPQPQVALDHLRTVIGAAEDVVVHCCAPHPPVELLVRAGASALSLDASLLTPATDDALGTAVEQGVGLLLGCVPSVAAPLPSAADSGTPVRRLWQRTGLDPDLLAPRVVVTPTCGLAGASEAYARAALKHCVSVAEALGKEPL